MNRDEFMHTLQLLVNNATFGKTPLTSIEYNRVVAEFDAMTAKIEEGKDTSEQFDDILNELWKLIYPGKTDWDYPGEVLNHIRVELERKTARIGELEADNARLLREHQVWLSLDLDRNVAGEEPKPSVFMANAVKKISELEAETKTLSSCVDELEKANEWISDALRKIRDWTRAYPIDMFPEPDMEKVRDILAFARIPLDAVSASNFRHVLRGIEAIIEKALPTKEVDNG